MGFRDLFAPIVLATMLNVIAFWLMWRRHRFEVSRQKIPLHLEFALFGYAFASLGSVLLLANGKLAGRLEVFASAVVSETIGSVILYLLTIAFIPGQGEARQNRIMAGIFGIMLTVGMIGAALT